MSCTWTWTRATQGRSKYEDRYARVGLSFSVYRVYFPHPTEEQKQKPATGCLDHTCHLFFRHPVLDRSQSQTKWTHLAAARLAHYTWLERLTPDDHTSLCVGSRHAHHAKQTLSDRKSPQTAIPYRDPSATIFVRSSHLTPVRHGALSRL
jgi:hypothetical protein